MAAFSLPSTAISYSLYKQNHAPHMLAYSLGSCTTYAALLTPYLLNVCSCEDRVVPSFSPLLPAAENQQQGHHLDLGTHLAFSLENSVGPRCGRSRALPPPPAPETPDPSPGWTRIHSRGRWRPYRHPSPCPSALLSGRVVSLTLPRRSSRNSGKKPRSFCGSFLSVGTRGDLYRYRYRPLPTRRVLEPRPRQQLCRRRQGPAKCKPRLQHRHEAVRTIGIKSRGLE
mmetsp:Transcript_24195/g.67283  ORF Transcript_24195/g.67283 Transcript_24195/m.67283 type:complete len:227 (-) Transcript_24195:819-1499(-)